MNRATMVTSSSISYGLVRHSSQPASRADSRSPTIAWAVVAMMGIEASCGFAFSVRAASQPLISGRDRSNRISVGRNRSALGIPGICALAKHLAKGSDQPLPTQPALGHEALDVAVQGQRIFMRQLLGA